MTSFQRFLHWHKQRQRGTRFQLLTRRSSGFTELGWLSAWNILCQLPRQRSWALPLRWLFVWAELIACSRNSTGRGLPWCRKLQSWRQRRTRHAASVLCSSHRGHTAFRGICHPLPQSRSQFLSLISPLISFVRSGALSGWTGTGWESSGPSDWFTFVAEKLRSDAIAIIWPTWRTLPRSLLRLNFLTHLRYRWDLTDSPSA